ncbi:Gonadotropin-releasing hormone receptor [Aphelenchoides besseyi]|nr:Gonadotropin-releasing hormone receptor [Aphelenchoides besseyi]KAI6223520.1 Gonadotropin-releasing hormone receptor [Aphelenchoides besseyi]
MDTAGSSSGIEVVDSAAEPFELSQDGSSLAIPERLLSDYLEMLLLAAMIIVGAPLNAMTLMRLVNSLRKSKGSGKTKQEATRVSFIWLKIHLTVIDLIVILLYCPAHIGWLISYTWKGGEFLCVAVQYSWDFCFHLMSFGVVGIAVDRVRTVYRLMNISTNAMDLHAPRKQLKFVRRLIIFCYVAAALFSVPQWFVWTTIEMTTWSQCTTIWHRQRAIQYMNNEEITESFQGERLYSIFHLFTVFWVPFIVLFAAYLYIVVFLFCYSIRPTITVDDPSGLLRVNNNDSDSADGENMHLWPNTRTPPWNGSIRSGSQTIPAWRLEMRSKMFRTTVYVIAAYLICWMPYNVMAMATFFDSELQTFVSMHLELLRVCVLLNTLLNPFIYMNRD